MGASLHIDAELGDIAETVFLPGDPLRAKHIAAARILTMLCALIKQGICSVIPGIIKEEEFLLWERAWECLLWGYIRMSL